MPGYEADDILATAARRLHDSPIELVLVTADKDALQLVDPRVTVLSVLGRTGERVVYDAAKVQEKWGVPPERIPDILALMGDSIDNIPGVPGVGEVTAQKLLREFGSLEALYANLAVVTGPKLREALAQEPRPGVPLTSSWPCSRGRCRSSSTSSGSGSASRSGSASGRSGPSSSSRRCSSRSRPAR